MKYDIDKFVIKLLTAIITAKEAIEAAKKAEAVKLAAYGAKAWRDSKNA